MEQVPSTKSSRDVCLGLLPQVFLGLGRGPEVNVFKNFLGDSDIQLDLVATDFEFLIQDSESLSIFIHSFIHPCKRSQPSVCVRALVLVLALEQPGPLSPLRAPLLPGGLQETPARQWDVGGDGGA